MLRFLVQFHPSLSTFSIQLNCSTHVLLSFQLHREPDQCFEAYQKQHCTRHGSC